ncbi:MAG: hypothetical protein B7X07_06390 [Actinobacteria bacterium 21-64-8]|nr:MAG: hypothetical protein B7X07_06390 [Actinobacteria bacterium 21-64-8]
MEDWDPFGPFIANVLQLKVTLLDFEPIVWRRVLVPDSIALPKLHRVIQQLMLWWEYHLHLFTIDGVEFGQPEMDDLDDFEWRNERGVKLVKHLEVGKSIEYCYDFGDNWNLTIELEKTWPVHFALKHAVCVDGQFAAPPEDVGGTGGFRQFLDALADENDDEHDNYVEWSGGNYDFARLDLAEINARLQQVR